MTCARRSPRRADARTERATRSTLRHRSTGYRSRHSGPRKTDARLTTAFSPRDLDFPVPLGQGGVQGNGRTGQCLAHGATDFGSLGRGHELRVVKSLDLTTQSDGNVGNMKATSGVGSETYFDVDHQRLGGAARGGDG